MSEPEEAKCPHPPEARQNSALDHFATEHGLWTREQFFCGACQKLVQREWLEKGNVFAQGPKGWEPA